MVSFSQKGFVFCMEKWFVMAKKADFDAWSEQFQISPILARIIRNRDITEPEDVRQFLYGTLEDCHSPHLMKDLDKAVDYLIWALKAGKYIRVIGDYDVDGICSAHILTKGLQVLGAKVDTAIPHRIHDGYGLNENLIREAKEDGVEMIVTCDNGIAASQQIERATSLGIGVIVTDHHEVPFETVGDQKVEKIPAALAVVDPKQGGDTYPFSGICGAVVAYKLLSALYETAGDLTDDKTRRNTLEELLEFAALATVCDVMELKNENRILVKEGIRRMQTTESLGLRALMEVNAIRPESLSAYHLGFVLGPCLNATGRLDTAKRSLELLNCTDMTQAMQVAAELKSLNDSRKDLTLKGLEEAVKEIKERQMEQDRVLVVYLPGVHESLAGIIAGRIREQYGKPTFVLTKGEEGVKGSGRSIEGYNMYEEMNKVAFLFTKFGGHKMAAGCSLEETNVDVLRRELNAGCTLTEEDFIPKVHIDVPMPLAVANQKLAQQLELLEPFGVGNAKPLFAQKNLVFRGAYRMGKDGRFARFRVQDSEDRTYQLVFFGDMDKFSTFMKEKYGEDSTDRLFAGKGDYPVSVVYQLGINSYQGRKEVQYLMQYYS